MSAPLKLTPREVSDLAVLLRQCSDASRTTNCYFGAYDRNHVRVGESVIAVSWDEDRREYVVDDCNGD